MDIVEGINLFRDLNASEGEIISNLMEVRDFKPDAVIYKEGESGNNNLNIIEKGKVRVERITVEGDQFLVATLKKGQEFGIMSFLDGKKHNATTIAEEETQLLVLERYEFDKLAETHPVIVLKILRNIAIDLAALVRNMNSQQTDLMHMMFGKSK
ncbi:MAG: cyclic nucleotide-binding domain-containing protein [Thermodesulfovibrionales bacterium]|nr:cyclic nucleotide-binding domain-containing protein [Thermodesulfovibrionales bacterium]